MCPSGCQKLHNTLHLAGGEPVVPLQWGRQGPEGLDGFASPHLGRRLSSYTGQLVVRVITGASPELQVGLPGDKKGARQRWDRQCLVRACPASFQSHSGIFLSTYCAPAAKQEAEAQRGREPCPRSHSVFAKGLRPDPRPSCFWHLVHGGWGRWASRNGGAFLLPQLTFKCPHAPRAKDHNIQVGLGAALQSPKALVMTWSHPSMSAVST